MRMFPALFAVALLILPRDAVPAELPSIDTPLKTGVSAKADAAVVIGVEEYYQLPHVPYADRDADAMYAFLFYTKGIPSSRIARLKSGDSRAKIMEAVADAGSLVSPGGTVWVYFAGHGAASPTTRQRILLPGNTTADEAGFDEAGMKVSDLQAMAGSGGGQVVMITDACFTGAGRGGEQLLSGGRTFTPAKATVVGRAVGWDAVQTDEVASPLESVQHGAFTYFAIGALRGWADGEVSGMADGTVTAEEAQSYVANALKSVGFREQSPSLVGDALESRVLSSGVRDRPPELSAFTIVVPPLVPHERVPPVVLPYVDPNRPGSGGGTSFDDVASLSISEKVKRQECDEDAKAKGAAARSKRLDALALETRASAAATWATIEPEATSCLTLTDTASRAECAAVVESFAKKAGSAAVSLTEGEESVSTACGTRTPAFAAESRAVWIPEVEQAKAVSAQLRVAPVVAKGPVSVVAKVPVSGAAVAVAAGGASAEKAGVPGQDWTSPTLGVMQWIPAGTFARGSPPSEASRGDDWAQHKVTLTKGYWMMEHEVSQGEWASVMESTPWSFSKCGPTCPVEQVSWDDAVSFAKKASSRDGVRYRLPTEAEWEYAARGGQSTTYAGGNELGSVGWYADNSSKTTHPGCQKARNEYGLCDLSGNVWEWVSDWYGGYPSGSVTDPTGAGSGPVRVFRGGSWLDAAEHARVASRYGVNPGNRGSDLGFRLVRAGP